MVTTNFLLSLYWLSRRIKKILTTMINLPTQYVHFCHCDDHIGAFTNFEEQIYFDPPFLIPLPRSKKYTKIHSSQKIFVQYIQVLNFNAIGLK